MTTVDARGISCPEPLLMLKKALPTEQSLTLLVDSKNAFVNCKEFAEKQGLAIETERDGDTYKMLINRKYSVSQNHAQSLDA